MCVRLTQRDHECVTFVVLVQIDNFPQAVYKKFGARDDAEKYLEERSAKRIEGKNCGRN